jgi:hypothetical protein
MSAARITAVAAMAAIKRKIAVFITVILLSQGFFPGSTVIGGSRTFFAIRLLRQKTVPFVVFNSDEPFVFISEELGINGVKLVWGVHPIDNFGEFCL